MSAKELRKLDDKEIRAMISNLDKELFTINFSRKVNGGEGSSKKRSIRKNKAVLLTVLNERCEKK